MLIEKNDIVVRSAHKKEYDAIMELVWKTFMKFEASDYLPEGIKNFQDFITDPTLYKMFIMGEYPIFVAVYKTQIIGMISLRSKTHISLLFVDKDYHRQGVGRMLMDYLSEYMRIERKEYKVTVNAAPYGVGFYHKLGFTDMDLEQKKDGIRFTPMILFL